MAFVSDTSGAHSLRSNDFDGDGHLDLLVSDTKGKQLLFYKGRGDGSFAPATTQATGTDISGFKVARLNDDTVFDLIALRSDGVRWRHVGQWRRYLPALCSVLYAFGIHSQLQLCTGRS